MLARLPRWTAASAAAVVFSIGASAAPISWKEVLHQDSAWYGGVDARRVADNVLKFQTAAGGWPKGANMVEPPSGEFLNSTKADERAATIDNDATTSQMDFLARVVSATSDDRYGEAFDRGLDYLLEAQSPSGGWPQYFPLRKGYYRHITYNDDAMVNVLTLLRAVERKQHPYEFVGDVRRARATAAVERAINCILRTQIRQNGELTVWCAQHDELTLEPTSARKFEPASLSGAESVGIIRFLMGVENPSDAVIAAIEGGVAWLRAHKITGIRVRTFTGADGKLDRVASVDPEAGPIWARFYELKTNRPVFVGRDEIVRYNYNEIERERRSGYAYFGTWPTALLESEYPAWKAARP